MALNGGSVAMRNTPDVAAVSDNIGIAYGNGSWGTDNGTSFAGPIWAGFAALINQQAAESGLPPIGFLNPALYAIANSGKYSGVFHDITAGNNIDTIGIPRSPETSSFYFAGPGYDLCTGLGTPTGQKLIDAILAPPDPLVITSGSGFTSSGPVGGPFNISFQNLLLTNSGNAPLGWSLTSTCQWLKVSTTVGELTPAGPATNITIGLNPIASSMPDGIYTATIWLTNINSGAGQSLTFALQIGQPLVQNGSSETSDYAHWIGAGDWDCGFGASLRGLYDLIKETLLTRIRVTTECFFTRII